MGKISSTSGYVIYTVRSLKDLIKIIDHFDKHPLITQKLADYLLFKQAYELILKKEHLTVEGLEKLVAIKASMNQGLNDQLKEAFPSTVPLKKPKVLDKIVTEPRWVGGFVSGDGSFSVGIIKDDSQRLGYRVRLAFTITQHTRDELLMRSLVPYFNCGFVYKQGDRCDYKVTGLKDILETIIPSLKKNKILGVKQLDFNDWCKVAELMENEAHLTLPPLWLPNLRLGSRRGVRMV